MPQNIDQLAQAPIDFVKTRTPAAWLDYAVGHQAELLIDHANCEKKAASTALSLMYRYVEHPALLQRLSRLAREELRHFEQVLAIMQQKGIEYRPLKASRYAETLRKAVRTHEPAKLVDLLIIGAIIEARSCERFAALCPLLGADLAKFYRGLLASEARHFKIYLTYAKQFAQGNITSRVEHFMAIDHELMNTPDLEFRFHSGVPMPKSCSEAGVG